MDLMDLFIKVDVEDKASDKLSTLANKTETLANKIGNGLETAAKIGTAAVGAASAAVTALVKTSIDAYAEYEQLVGGVDALYGDASQKLQEYAAEAFKTAGVSINEFLDVSTAFAGALVRSLDGDVSAAAELANKAVKDMGDNANRFGRSISDIQAVYRGLAREQYVLLDNLSLGYAGTSKGMYDLMVHAKELNEEFAQTAEFSLDTRGHLEANFSDMIEAIHIVQEELNVTGTTALEASTTISGSVGMAKAAWKNLLVAIADENQDFGAKMDEFVETIVGTTNESGEAVGGVLNNILPRVEIALNGVGTLVTTALPKIMEYIPGIITDFLPKIVTAGAGIVRSLGEGIYDNKDEILGLFFGMVDDALGILKNGDGITNFLSAGGEILNDIIDGIDAAIPDLSDAALGIIKGLTNYFSDPTNIAEIANGALKIVQSLAEELPKVVSELTNAALKLISGLVDYLSDEENLKEMGRAAVAIVKALAEAIVAILFNIGTYMNEAVRDMNTTAQDAINAKEGGMTSKFSELASRYDEYNYGISIEPYASSENTDNSVENSNNTTTNNTTNNFNYVISPHEMFGMTPEEYAEYLARMVDEEVNR